jgi:hypothetical protein
MAATATGVTNDTAKKRKEAPSTTEIFKDTVQVTTGADARHLAPKKVYTPYGKSVMNSFAID